jgi:hypothetical protein
MSWEMSTKVMLADCRTYKTIDKLSKRKIGKMHITSTSCLSSSSNLAVTGRILSSITLYPDSPPALHRN